MPDQFFEYAFLLCLIALEVVRVPARIRNSRDRVGEGIEESRVQGLEAVLMTFSFAGLYFLPVSDIFLDWYAFADYSLPSFAGWAGIVMFVTAIWLTWRSMRDLGQNWSPSLEIKKEHKLVTSGVYHYIRHPIYAAMWLAVIGQALVIHNWIAGLAGLVTYIPIYFTRIRREEALMLEHFGDEYRDYMKQTGRILPPIGS